MTFRLRVRAKAERDIRGARDWYERQAEGLGQDFGDELDSVLARVAAQPLNYSPLHRNIRRALTRRFPYSVYFIVEYDRVTILRVLHQARDPNEWRR